MLNLFKFHADPSKLEDFEKNIRANPKLMTELTLPDSPEILKFALSVLDNYTDHDYDIIASVIVHKFYRPDIMKRVTELCKNLNNTNKSLFKLLFVNSALSKSINEMHKIVELGYHISHPDIITNYMHYIETNDGVPLAKSLLNISHEKDINHYNLIETIKELVHDPKAFEHLLLAQDKPIEIEIQVNPKYQDETSAEIRLVPSEGLYYAYQLYDKLPKEQQRSVVVKLKKAFDIADTKFASIVLGNKYNISFNDAHTIEQIKPLIGPPFPKTTEAFGTLYDKLNSREAIKQINALGGDEQKAAMKRHGSQMSNIMSAIIALSK